MPKVLKSCLYSIIMNINSRIVSMMVPIVTTNVMTTLLFFLYRGLFHTNGRANGPKHKIAMTMLFVE